MVRSHCCEPGPQTVFLPTVPKGPAWCANAALLNHKSADRLAIDGLTPGTTSARVYRCPPMLQLAPHEALVMVNGSPVRQFQMPSNSQLPSRALTNGEAWFIMRWPLPNGR